MKNKQIALYAVISGCLSLSGPTFASSKGPVLIHKVPLCFGENGTWLS
ncbi:hypothetical protein VZ17_004524 [Salmonella enterica subsp. enterica serovar Abaetetuba]|nr:hypothetical protein [Salmonella enterica subsp. enterica serovar Abaetetuba]